MKIIYGLLISLILTNPIVAELSPTATNLFEPSITTFSFSPSVRSSGGKTEYEMDIDQFGVQLRSLLEFPLDYIMVGTKAELVLNSGRADQYRFEGSIYKSMNDPDGSMFDSDWSNTKPDGSYRPYRMFSYTESEAEVKAILAQFRAERRVYSEKGIHLGIFVGFRYSKIEQDIFGIKGWQLDDLGQRFDFDVKDIFALSYKVTYKLPHVGVRFTRSNPKFDVSVSTAYTIALVDDVDDHVLRNKLSTAEINGKGLLADGEMKWKISGKDQGLFLKLTGDISYIRASGSQLQAWYGDELMWDPNINDYVVSVPAGTSISGIPHDINLTQYTLGLDLGFSF